MIIPITSANKIIQIQKQIDLCKMKEKLSKEEKFMVKIMTLWIKEELKKLSIKF